MANPELERLRREIQQVRARQAEMPARVPAPPVPAPPRPELERMIADVDSARGERVGRDITAREERLRQGQVQPKPPKQTYRMGRLGEATGSISPFGAWKSAMDRLPFSPERGLQTDYAASGAARMQSPQGAPLLWGQRATAGVPLPKTWRQQASEWYPWSDYGQKIVAQTPASVMEQRVASEMGAAGIYYWGLPAMPRLGLPELPPRIELSPAQGGGETIPHEYSHASQIPWWSKENEAAFSKDLKAWLFGESIDEWDEQKRYIWNTWNERSRGQPGFGTTEVYAYFAGTPWLIPPELEKWYPQYDLRSRGHTAREGFRGPGAIPGSTPKPPRGPRIR